MPTTIRTLKINKVRDEEKSVVPAFPIPPPLLPKVLSVLNPLPRYQLPITSNKKPTNITIPKVIREFDIVEVNEWGLEIFEIRELSLEILEAKEYKVNMIDVEFIFDSEWIEVVFDKEDKVDTSLATDTKPPTTTTPITSIGAIITNKTPLRSFAIPSDSLDI